MERIKNVFSGYAQLTSMVCSNCQYKTSMLAILTNAPAIGLNCCLDCPKCGRGILMKVIE